MSGGWGVSRIKGKKTRRSEENESCRAKNNGELEHDREKEQGRLICLEGVSYGD